MVFIATMPIILGLPRIRGGGAVAEPNSSNSAAQRYRLACETQSVEQMSSLDQPSSQRRRAQSFISELIFRKTILTATMEVQRVGGQWEGLDSVWLRSEEMIPDLVTTESTSKKNSHILILFRNGCNQYWAIKP